MGSKPKAGSSSKPPQKEEKKKAQRERFIEAARAIGVDETGGEFELAFEAIARLKKR
jgi:hypothetical protein